MSTRSGRSRDKASSGAAAAKKHAGAVELLVVSLMRLWLFPHILIGFDPTFVHTEQPHKRTKLNSTRDPTCCDRVRWIDESRELMGHSSYRQSL